ncbi:alanine racemase [Ponticoccus sp. SC2-23]|uniref:alanine racemase n=1 Tax=Alexandriicola marinus TaxID=2081710 RepID=UPI000FD8C46B|nr:alanine racemase [Alexandriicola marinus]MBM1220955.1 alanine racemase [Ponticoccus sp. SC6-9]MBM1225525.1 alanine racemase [Ponticoccus sp. SC6-15]MBM1227708.1 alanine racemase [Ponticoccus sp. SC6-38]MBM1234654.1 alanine racemase [Ponticoccus sp. SC6-45]MBM1238210.1 alanine racemase [Ponticoccus sp. SC6-49]MBM1244157.1 alanine racemase [Ponticoccus sp. SC2-64]MBM1248178.1 alanine racemase [Ponticoccus sp. SC6-42]MBM1252610.1 alanine racemase [Ponticoccus sp. SC6-33]MBM1256219.1 alanin
MIADGTPGSWCEIRLDRISRNLGLALDLVPRGRRFCAVMKADAYGHGIAQVVPLIREHGVSCIGITSNDEARAVRAAGFDGTIIRVRAATPTEIEAARDARVEEQVASRLVARKLRALRDAGHPVRAHLALNAKGMSRDGLEIATREGRETARAILDLLGDDIVGICTHFPCNTPENLPQSDAEFRAHVDWVFANSDLRREAVLVHAGSSLTLVSGQEVSTDMYRCAAILYGILKPDLGFRTTMALKTRVVSVAEYPKGSTVGYDRAARLESDRRLACLSVGYANGFRRDIGPDAGVLINGREAPVRGKVSMNTIVVDVTGLPEVQVGDVATVFGGADEGQTPVEAAERQFRTIMADLYSDWGLRNQRIYR